VKILSFANELLEENSIEGVNLLFEIAVHNAYATHLNYLVGLIGIEPPTSSMLFQETDAAELGNGQFHSRRETRRGWRAHCYLNDNRHESSQ